MRKILFMLMLFITTMASAGRVTITCYNPVPRQCSGDPLLTASGRRIDVKKLDKGQLRYCAVSRDLLGKYKYGDIVRVYIKEGHPYNGEWMVVDTMAKRWNNKIDLLVSVNAKVGKWTGSLTRTKASA